MGYSIRGDEHNFPYSFTHTHIRLTVLCPGLPRWAGTRKVKPVWILLKQESASGSGISWDICKSARRCRQITMHPTTQFFYRPDALPAAQPTVSKHWRQKVLKGTSNWYPYILFDAVPVNLSSCQSGIVGSSYNCQTCVGLGLQLVPRQKRSHHLQCTKLLLPVWQSSCADGTWRPAEVLLVSIYCWFVCPAHLYGHYAANIYT